MTCGEAREYLFAFLDNELDAALSIELQRHLDGCASCAREAEIERAAGKRLTNALQVEPVPDFPGTLTGLIGANSGQVGPGAVMPLRGIVRWDRMLGVAASIGLVVMVGVWFGLSRDSGPGLAKLLVSDFEHFLEEGGKLQLASNDRREVTAWLQDKTQLAVSLPVPGDAECELLGGRKCKLAGEPAAFAAYRMNGEPASLVAVAGRAFDFKDMRAVERGGQTHWVAVRGEFTVLACRRGELVYAAVSRLAEQQLLCLMTGPNYESH